MNQWNDWRDRTERWWYRTRRNFERRNVGRVAGVGGARVGRVVGAGGIKPGWWLLLGLALYALFATWMWWRNASALATLRQTRPQSVQPASQPNTQPLGLPAPSAATGTQLRWPVVGARIPSSDEALPNAPRRYRRGVSHGFVFLGNNAGIPVGFGTPVVASADGQVIRADTAYKENTRAGFARLLVAVQGGANDTQMNQLRGRQVLLRHNDGTVTRYAHLGRIMPDIALGVQVRQGQVLGTVGNSGTLEAAQGKKSNARLLFEVWRNNRFLGWKQSPTEIRANVPRLVQGWP